MFDTYCGPNYIYLLRSGKTQHQKQHDELNDDTYNRYLKEVCNRNQLV